MCIRDRAIYNGDRHPDWQGDIFAGALVDQSIRHLKIDDNNQVINESRIPIGQRVRAVQQAPDGYLYVLTDEDNGQLLRLEP